MTLHKDEKVLTVGGLRELIRSLPDDLPIGVVASPGTGECTPIVGGDYVNDGYMLIDHAVESFLQLVSDGRVE